MDEIRGTVSITPPVDTKVDDVDIEFVGTSRTYVERLTTAAAVSGRSEAFHQFLKLEQPGLHMFYPDSGVMKAGQTYDFPFVFAVPQQMLLRICQHKINSPAVRDAHLLLPPSFGDKDLANHPDALDDMAPEMANVRYGVFARLTRVKHDGDEISRHTIASKARRIQVIPKYEEQPPLSVGAQDPDYTMRKEKKIKKNVFKGKVGTLVMEAHQPQSFRLPAPNRTNGSPISTMATVMLRFDPSEESSQPPRLGSLQSKLKASTFFASTARMSFPTKAHTMLDLSQGVHSVHMNLSSRCMANVEWKKHDPTKPDAIERRDSAMSMLDAGVTPEPSETYKGKTYYTARLLVPISLPTNKAFVPTFHTCLISRVYALQMSLSLHGTGLGGSMDIKVPVQISSDGSNGEVDPHRGSVSSQTADADIDDEDVSDFFERRTIHVPDVQFMGRSRIGSAPAPTRVPASVPTQAASDDAPPGYSVFAPAAQPGSQRHMSVPVY